MLTISEQIHKYRSMKAQDTASNMTDDSVQASAVRSIVLHGHPKTKDFFQKLMSRWQNGSNATKAAPTPHI